MSNAAKRTLPLVIPIVVLAVFLLSRSTTGKLLAVTVRGQTQCPFGLTMTSMDSVHSIVASTNRIRAASRLVREDGDLQLWDTPRGPFWMPKASAPQEPGVLAEEENQIYGKGSSEVRPGDIVLDCGADIGAFTRTALGRGAKLVVAIEPAPDKEPCLRRNFEREISDGRVIVVQKGVWNQEGSFKLYVDSIVEKRSSEGVDVPVTTIDKIVADLRLPRVDFIKMDIEGSEKPALAGAAQTLVRYHPRLSIATEHLPDDAVAIPRAVRSLVSDYQVQCGPCEWADGHIRPQVIYLF